MLPSRPTSAFAVGALALALLALASVRPSAPLLAASSPEFRYVDEEDPAKAAEMLDKLVDKYDSPRKCERLLETLAKKRPYPGRMADRDTLDHVCTDGRTRQFTYLLPKRYSPRRPPGILVWLHGAVSQPAPGGGANEAGMFAPAVADENLIVVGPSTFDRVEWGDPACRELVHYAVDFVKRSFPVDENRIFLAGDSDGGRGTYAMAETEATTFAAAIPVIGSPGGVTRFANLRNLPFLAINGGKDSIFAIDHVRAAVEGMKKAGIDLDWRLVEEAGHDPRLFLKFADDVAAFLKAHPREPFPKTVHWSVDPSRKDDGGGFPANTFRWIRIDEAGAATSNHEFADAGDGVLRRDLPRIEATRDGNRFDVKTRGVRRYSILVAGEMADLEKEIEVVTNGKPSFRGVVAPDARVILEEARRFRDRELLFVNRIAVDVDAALAGD